MQNRNTRVPRFFKAPCFHAVATSNHDVRKRETWIFLLAIHVGISEGKRSSRECGMYFCKCAPLRKLNLFISHIEKDITFIFTAVGSFNLVHLQSGLYNAANKYIGFHNFLSSLIFWIIWSSFFLWSENFIVHHLLSQLFDIQLWVSIFLHLELKYYQSILEIKRRIRFPPIKELRIKVTTSGNRLEHSQEQAIGMFPSFSRTLANESSRTVRSRDTRYNRELLGNLGRDAALAGDALGSRERKRERKVSAAPDISSEPAKS